MLLLFHFHFLLLLGCLPAILTQQYGIRGYASAELAPLPSDSSVNKTTSADADADARSILDSNMPTVPVSKNQTPALDGTTFSFVNGTSGPSVDAHIHTPTHNFSRGVDAKLDDGAVKGVSVHTLSSIPFALTITVPSSVAFPPASQ
jgi:hypothetical protein